MEHLGGFFCEKNGAVVLFGSNKVGKLSINSFTSRPVCQALISLGLRHKVYAAISIDI